MEVSMTLLPELYCVFRHVDKVLGRYFIKFDTEHRGDMEHRSGVMPANREMIRGTRGHVMARVPSANSYSVKILSTASHMTGYMINVYKRSQD